MIRIVAVAIVALSLAACEQDRAGRILIPGLPPIPADIAACWDQYVKIPKGALTKQKVAQIMADQNLLIEMMRGCGKRFVEFYNANARLFERIAKEQAAKETK